MVTTRGVAMPLALLPVGGLQRSVQGHGHGGIPAQEFLPTQLDFRLSSALAGQPDPFGIDCQHVVDAVDADLPLECLVEDGRHESEYRLGPTPLRRARRSAAPARR